MDYISEAAWLSERYRATRPVNLKSAVKRSLICGVAVNDADYVTKSGGQCDVAYKLWLAMIHRCYGTKAKLKYPSYEGVTVCDEWLSFMNYRNWWVRHHIDGWQMDKDLLVLDNKVYSPDTCAYVPQFLNVLVNGKSSPSMPTGVARIGRKFTAQISLGNVATNLGTFNTPVEAHVAWLTAKLDQALEWKPLMDSIDARIYPTVVAKIWSKTNIN